MRELETPEQYAEYSSALRSQPIGRAISFGAEERYLSSEFQAESNQALRKIGLDTINLYHLKDLATQQLPSDNFSFDRLNRAVAIICEERIQVVRERTSIA